MEHAVSIATRLDNLLTYCSPKDKRRIEKESTREGMPRERIAQLVLFTVLPKFR